MCSKTCCEKNAGVHFKSSELNCALPHLYSKKQVKFDTRPFFKLFNTEKLYRLAHKNELMAQTNFIRPTGSAFELNHDTTVAK